jgi:hypothetical protein
MTAKLLLSDPSTKNTGIHLNELAIFSTIMWFPAYFVVKVCKLQFNLYFC